MDVSVDVSLHMEDSYFTLYSHTLPVLFCCIQLLILFITDANTDLQ